MQNEKLASVVHVLWAPWTLSRKFGIYRTEISGQYKFYRSRIFEKVFREGEFLAQLKGRSVPNNATRFLVLFRDLSARGFWMEISLLNTFKTITALDMKKNFVDNTDLSVQERKSWCFVCCWNTSDLEFVLNRLHPGIISVSDSRKNNSKMGFLPGKRKKSFTFPK